MRKIVTHLNPDLDAVASTWLLVRWLPGWQEVEFAFVPAGQTIDKDKPDKDPNIMHVDTGNGMLDHHQAGDYTCAARITLEYISNNQSRPFIPDSEIKEVGSTIHVSKLPWNKQALSRMVEVVTQTDHFQEVHYPNPEADYLDFRAEEILNGWKLLYRDQDEYVLLQGFKILDAIYQTMLSKVDAEQTIEKKGIIFDSPFGKSIAIETKNSQVNDIAQKRGYKLVIRRHPQQQNINVKAPPPNLMIGEKSTIDLTNLYEALKAKDPQADWFLHASKTMLLNGSAKNPNMKHTTLTLDQVIGIIKNL